MQQGSTSPQSGIDEQYRSAQGGRSGTATADYLSETVEPTRQYVGSAFGYVGDQIRVHPLVAGSIALGVIGAMIGSRIAQIQAMRRRKSALQRAQELLEPLGLMALMEIARRRMRARGQGFPGPAMDMAGAIRENLSSFRVQRQRARGPQDAIRQVGYALSLIPVTVAFLRNPLVRDIGFRMMSRRIGRR